MCVDGSRQRLGVDYWETYAPVVHWSTVRMVLVLKAMLGLKSKQIDYTQAFPQAPLEDPVFMKIPQGWYFDTEANSIKQSDDPFYVDHHNFSRLRRNLYGCKQAARNWYLHLKEGLIQRGFTQSKIDPCLYLRKDIMIVIYTDDCIILSHDSKTIDDFCDDLSKDFALTSEGDIEDFLGVHINIKSNPTDSYAPIQLKLTQPGLIDQILMDVGIHPDQQKANDRSRPHTKFVPAREILHPSPNSPPFSASWNYRSIVGKLNFLAANTRPDISMATHMCAKYVSNPNQAHQEAIKYLCRYLLLTRDKGIILTPKNENTLNAYVDSDFAGQWSPATSHLRDSTVSRSGYIIVYCGCPILWVSKLQGEVALSTCEAEYQALSQCMRDLLPLRTLLSEIQNIFDHSSANLLAGKTIAHTKMHKSIVFEDNSACLEIANNPEQYRPRTKHIGIKYHHFADQIKNGNVAVEKIDTKDQWADALTKPLARDLFERLRRLYMGW
jgi:hypothetical protein